MSTALQLFHDLCDLGDGLQRLRDTFPLASDPWTACTDLLGQLDHAVDVLVRSEGLAGDAEEAP